jgi:hypothetical protein
MKSPDSIAVDSLGNIYITLPTNCYVVKINKMGEAFLVSGNGTPGYSGDGGPASVAQLNNPTGIALDSAGDVLVVDTNNHRVRKISNGVITTVAGNGTPGFSGDNGPATAAQLNYPRAVAVDSDGSIYVADCKNMRIRKIRNGIISTVAGNGSSGMSGDGLPATRAQLSQELNGITVDSVGRVYIVDGDRVRVLTPATLNAAPR